jgi:protocatechuate 3,4-dioxygenase beta subunit
VPHAPTYTGFALDLHAAKLPARTRFVSAGYATTPRKGQWYLSGAEPCAYRAPNDLSQVFTILHPVQQRKLP